MAAVDMGTNSTRLLVADVDGDRLVTLDRRMRITRLGAGVDAARRLQPEAIARVTDALGEFAAAIQEHRVERVRAVTTSAARDAINADELLDAATAMLGVRPEIISGIEEGSLSFAGAVTDLQEPGPYLVVDVGGGSTELVSGAGTSGAGEPDGVVSIDAGCVRITEQYLHSDPPQPEELSAAVTVVRDLLADAARMLPGAAAAKTLVGLAGTVSAMAAIEQGLAAYDRDRIHGFRLKREVAEELFRTLATESSAERRHNPGLEPGRVDVIVGGIIVVVCVLRQWDFDELVCSESDILDGMARRLAPS